MKSQISNLKSQAAAPGTVTGVGLWLLTSFGFQLYLRMAGQFSLTYGSIGGVIVLRLWLYLTGAAILLGGEVNSEIEAASGSASQADVPEGQPRPRPRQRTTIGSRKRSPD